MDKFEEFRLAVEGAAKLSDRRRNMNNVYLIANLTLCIALALLTTLIHLNPRWGIVGILELAAVGIVLCLVWNRLIGKYSLTIGNRVALVRALEKEIPGLIQLSDLDQATFEEKPGGFIRIKDHERALSWFFMVIYLIFFLLAGMPNF